MTPDFGIDIDCGPDGLSPTFDLVEGRAALVQAILRRFQTQRGSLVDDPNYGIDLTSWVAKKADSAQRFAWQQQLESEASKDERVVRARARLTFDTTTGFFRFTLTVSTADGPFTMTASVSDVSVDLLAVS